MGAGRTSATSAEAESAAVPVAVSTVTERRVAEGQTFVGTVMPIRGSTVGSGVSERVIEFPVNEGDRVAKGQVLAKLRTATLEIDLAAARAELEARKQNLAELEHGTRPEEIEQAKAKLMGAEALTTYTTTRLNRFKRLFERDRAASDEYNEAVSAHDRALAARKEAQEALKLAIEGPRKEKIAQTRAAVQAQQEEIRRIEDEIGRHRIEAPFDGYVIAEHTEIGQWLDKGSPVVELAELDSVDVRALVLEDYIRYLRVGTEARVEIGALPGESLTGQVALIVPQADVRSRCFPVKVRLQNRDTPYGLLLKAGMFASVTLPVGKVTSALLVPKDAVVLGGPRPLVYVVDPEQQGSKRGKARSVRVELGIAFQGLIQVKGTIKAGEQVVVQGNERLHPDQEVLVTEQTDPEAFVGRGPTTTSPNPAGSAGG
ncbi:MAG: efflux RND transporter periplasmic adaptor subunit [Phycisphaerae bacterium]|nr:efflux RND transporter periplasmic adaptor subunit [Phycisphaerae bacterium]